MSAYQEPPNGDFVAYVEALQRESAARLQLKAHAPGLNPPAVGPGPTESPAAAHSGAGAPALSRQQADELIARLARRGGSALSAGAALGLAAGLLLLMYWLVVGGGPFSFLIGVALVAWSASRLRSARRAASTLSSREHARIEKLLGRAPSA